MMNDFDKIRSSRQSQIFLSTLLITFMYVLYIAFDFLVLSEHALGHETLLRLYFTIPLFLVLSILSYIQKSQELVYIGLSSVPVIVAISSMIMMSESSNFTLYIAEINIIIFWVFITSGLRFKETVLVTSIVLLITIYGVLIYHSLREPLYIMHLYLTFVLFMLSLMGSYLIEKLSLEIYFKTKESNELSMTDELTELSSRSKFDFIIQNELARSRRYNYKFGLLIMEIDNFKTIYNKFGEQVRDDLLIVVSSIINDQVRSTDMEIRWSEDEFVVVCLELDLEQLNKIGNTILTSMRNYDFGRLGRVTLSVGATINKVSDNDVSIVQRLDKALLKAKHDGGNCVKSV